MKYWQFFTLLACVELAPHQSSWVSIFWGAIFMLNAAVWIWTER